MKTIINLRYDIRKSLLFTFLIAGLFLMPAIFDSCNKTDNANPNTNDSVVYSLNDLLGTWQRHSLVTNSSNQGFWIYASIVNNEGSQTVHFILQNGHNLDTTYTGEGASMTSDGIITSASDSMAHSYLSTDKNLWVGTTKRNDLYTLVFDQKTISGTSYSAADFQGTWQIHYLASGGQWTGWIHAVSVMDNAGSSISYTFVKSDGHSEISSGGTTLISANGIITNDAVPTYNGFMSSDKKLMCTTMTDGGGGGGLLIAEKVVTGITYSNADLSGKWQLHEILAGSQNWTNHGILTIDASGNGILSNMVKDNGGTYNDPGTIVLSISSDGIVTYGTDFHGFLSADKKLVIGTRSHDSGNAYSLVALQKMP
jgi:hypothetical protein